MSADVYSWVTINKKGIVKADIYLTNLDRPGFLNGTLEFSDVFAAEADDISDTDSNDPIGWNDSRTVDDGDVETINQEFGDELSEDQLSIYENVSNNPTPEPRYRTGNAIPHSSQSTAPSNHDAHFTVRINGTGDESGTHDLGKILSIDSLSYQDSFTPKEQSAVVRFEDGMQYRFPRRTKDNFNGGELGYYDGESYTESIEHYPTSGDRELIPSFQHTFNPGFGMLQGITRSRQRSLRLVGTFAYKNTPDDDREDYLNHSADRVVDDLASTLLLFYSPQPKPIAVAAGIPLFAGALLASGGTMAAAIAVNMLKPVLTIILKIENGKEKIEEMDSGRELIDRFGSGAYNAIYQSKKVIGVRNRFYPTVEEMDIYTQYCHEVLIPSITASPAQTSPTTVQDSVASKCRSYSKKPLSSHEGMYSNFNQEEQDSDYIVPEEAVRPSDQEEENLERMNNLLLKTEALWNTETHLVETLSELAEPSEPKKTLKRLVPDDGNGGDRFGSTVALASDENTAIIGAVDDESNGGSSGPAYVFEQSGNTWTQKAKLVPNDGMEGDRFGTSVEISDDGTRALIGATGDDSNNSGAGSAYIFGLVDNNWEQLSKLVPYEGGLYDAFGSSVALSSDGTTALIGDVYQSVDSMGGVGAAYVFTESDGVWEQQARLDNGGGTARLDDKFGCSVGLVADGSTAIVGAKKHDYPHGDNSGAAYIFSKSEDSWSKQTKLTADSGDSADQFGHSVAIADDGTTALIGAAKDEDPNGANAGSAYIFDSSSGTWSQRHKTSAGGGESGDKFGRSVSLSGDGNTAIVGAVGGNNPSGKNAGSAYVFDINEDEWTQSNKYIPNSEVSGGNFGCAVGVSSDGSRILIGANREENSGAAYLYE